MAFDPIGFLRVRATGLTTKPNAAPPQRKGGRGNTEGAEARSEFTDSDPPAEAMGRIALPTRSKGD